MFQTLCPSTSCSFALSATRCFALVNLTQNSLPSISPIRTLRNVLQFCMLPWSCSKAAYLRQSPGEELQSSFTMDWVRWVRDLRKKPFKKRYKGSIHVYSEQLFQVSWLEERRDASKLENHQQNHDVRKDAGRVVKARTISKNEREGIHDMIINACSFSEVCWNYGLCYVYVLARGELISKDTVSNIAPARYLSQGPVGPAVSCGLKLCWKFSPGPIWTHELRLILESRSGCWIYLDSFSFCFHPGWLTSHSCQEMWGSFVVSSGASIVDWCLDQVSPCCWCRCRLLNPDHQA